MPLSSTFPELYDLPSSRFDFYIQYDSFGPFLSFENKTRIYHVHNITRDNGLQSLPEQIGILKLDKCHFIPFTILYCIGLVNSLNCIFVFMT